MHVYFIIFIIIFGTYLFERLFEDKHRIDTPGPKFQKALLCSFIINLFILFFISAFRAENIGTDHLIYRETFRQGRNAYFAEKGFVYLNVVLSFISKNILILDIVVSSILCIGVYTYIVKTCPANLYSFAMIIFSFQPYLYIQTSFNIMRQCCATGIILMSIPLLTEGKIKKYTFMVLFAFLFHQASIAMLILILIKKVNIRPGLFRIFSILFTFANIFKLDVVFFRLAYSLFGRAGHGGNYGNKEASLLNNILYIAMIFIILWYFTIPSIYNNLYSDDKEQFFVKVFLFSITILPFAVSNDVLYRVYIYLAFAAIPGIVTICKKFRKKNPLIEWTFAGYYSAFYIGYMSYLYIKKIEAYIPFKFIF